MSPDGSWGTGQSGSESLGEFPDDAVACSEGAPRSDELRKKLSRKDERELDLLVSSPVVVEPKPADSSETYVTNVRFVKPGTYVCDYKGRVEQSHAQSIP